MPALYKGLRDASSRLGIVNLPPPKSCVHMKATANPAEAHAAFSQAVSAALSRAGWQPLEAGGWMLPTASGSSGVGGAAPDQGHDGGSSGEAGGGDSGDRGPGSALQEALTVRLELELQPPKSLLLVLTAGA